MIDKTATEDTHRPHTRGWVITTKIHTVWTLLPPKLYPPHC